MIFMGYFSIKSVSIMFVRIKHQSNYIQIQNQT